MEFNQTSMSASHNLIQLFIFEGAGFGWKNDYMIHAGFIFDNVDLKSFMHFHIGNFSDGLIGITQTKFPECSSSEDIFLMPVIT